MRPLSIYISLLFFMACLAAPSVAVLSNLKVKEAKVAKLFDMEEEDARDNDSEKEKENEKEKEQNPSEKFFKSILASIKLPVLGTATLIHYTLFQCPVSDPIKELVTPPPRA